MKAIIDFLKGSDLWANIIGGVIAALVFGFLVSIRDRKRHKILRELTEIMGLAIKHRNLGMSGKFTDKDVWINQAKAIEADAIAKAKELSTTAGSLVEWLDKIDPWDVNSEEKKYISILSTVITRIRGLLERNS
jgi:hypothetical protein